MPYQSTGERQLGRRNLTDDQRAVVGNDVREARSAIATAEKMATARDVKAGKKSMEATVVSIEKQRTRASVAKEASVSERKIKYAQTIRLASASAWPNDILCGSS